MDLSVVLAGPAANWGDVPTWLSSVATMLALLFAAVAAVAAQRAFRIESERDRISAEARQQQEAFLRRAQAALVSAWWGRQPDVPGAQPDKSGAQPDKSGAQPDKSGAQPDKSGAQPAGRWGAFVRNASETPVYQASLTTLDIHNPDVSERLDLAIVPPGAEPVFHPSDLADGRPVQDGQRSVDYRVEIAFTDSAGVRWIRDQQGRLSELRPEALIWADEQHASALRRFAEQFLAVHGVKLRFRTGRIETLRQELVSAADTEQVPDLVVGPHDWIGGLVSRGVIEPLILSGRRKQDFVPEAIKAMTYQDELYGVPYALDTVVVIRNTDLAPEPPATFDELLATGERLRAARRTEHTFVMQVGPGGDPYYMYPLLLAAGGWLFGRGSDGRLDPGVTGLGAPETLAAFERFASLGSRGSGALRPEIDRDQAISLFRAGRTPYLICASLAFTPAYGDGLPFAVGPVPPFAGFPAVRPFVSVLGFFLTRRGRNKTIARDLAAHYLTRTDVSLALYDPQPRPLALRAALDQVLARDPVMAEFCRECRGGDLMPSIPQMAEIWRLLARAEVALVTGAAVAATVRRLADGVRSLPLTPVNGRQRAVPAS